MNFSIFSRPAAMARASLRQRPPPHTGTADKASTTSTRVESTVLQSASGSGPRTATAPGPALFVDQRTAWPSQQQPKDVRFPCAAAAPPTTAGNLQQERPSNNNNSMTPPQKQVETRKASEAAGATATSSVCSGNGAGTTGKDDESWRQQKTKSLQAECSASQDDDPDDESGGMRRSCSRGGAKRSRTAEVHNLSERRRRDRINEKMRALQELIPNCNKIDKASMLDEAIEYLKTLQLQVQMMSMGSGLCIPPMLLPPAMQHHLQIPPAAAHFPHLGMGLGYGGMGVLDMNSAAAVAVPFPHMPGAHFPCPGAPLPRGLGIGMPARNTMPVFGVPPGQPIQPPFPSLAGLPVRPNLAPPHASSAAMANMVQEEQQQQQQQQSLNNGASAAASDPQLQTIVQAERQHFSVPSSAQTESDQFLDGGGNRAICTGRNEAET